MRLIVNGEDVGKGELVADNLCVRYALSEGEISIEVMHIETVGEMERMIYDCSVTADLLDLVEVELGTSEQTSSISEQSGSLVQRHEVPFPTLTQISCAKNGERIYQRPVTDRSIVEIGIVHRRDLPYILSIAARDSRKGDLEQVTAELEDSDRVTILVAGG